MLLKVLLLAHLLRNKLLLSRVLNKALLLLLLGGLQCCTDLFTLLFNGRSRWAPSTERIILLRLDPILYLLGCIINVVLGQLLHCLHLLGDLFGELLSRSSLCRGCLILY